MRVIAVPRPDFPPSAEALRLADAVLDSLSELEPAWRCRLVTPAQPRMTLNRSLAGDGSVTPMLFARTRKV